MQKREKIILVGGGGHCKSCIDVIEYNNSFDIYGVLDRKENVGKKVSGYSIVGSENEHLQDMMKKCNNFLISIGQIKNYISRKLLYEKIKNLGGNFPFIISNKAYVSKRSQIGEGTIVLHDVCVNAHAHIGINCIINTKANIEHDCVIGDHCHVSTGAFVNGDCHIGAGSFLGSSCVIANQIKITENVVIGAGAVVIKDINEPGTYVGNPAKKVK